MQKSLSIKHLPLQDTSDIEINIKNFDIIENLSLISNSNGEKGSQLCKAFLNHLIWIGCASVVKSLARNDENNSNWHDQVNKEQLLKLVNNASMNYYLGKLCLHGHKKDLYKQIHSSRITMKTFEAGVSFSNMKEFSPNALTCLYLASFDPLPSNASKVLSSTRPHQTTSLKYLYKNKYQMKRIVDVIKKIQVDTVKRRKNKLKERNNLVNKPISRTLLPKEKAVGKKKVHDEFESRGELTSSENLFPQSDSSAVVEVVNDEDKNISSTLKQKREDIIISGSDTDTFDSNLIADILGLENKTEELLDASNAMKDVMNRFSTEVEEDIMKVKKRIERDTEMLEHLNARRVHKRAIEQYKAMKRAETSLSYSEDMDSGLGARVGPLKLPTDIYYKTIGRIRGHEHRIEMWHDGDNNIMRFTVENDFFKKYSVETSTAEVFEKLCDTGRRFIKDLSDEEEISKLMEEIAVLLTLKASKTDRRKSYLVLKKYMPKRKLSLIKTANKTPGKAKGRIVSSNSESDWANTTSGDDGYDSTMDDNIVYDKDTLQMRETAATKIQSIARGANVRSENANIVVNEAATTSNAVARGRIGQIYTSIMELDLTYEYAATEIQRIARGFIVRNNFDLIYDRYLSSRPTSAASIRSKVSSSIPSRPTSRPTSAINRMIPLEPPSETENAEVESDHMVWKIIKDESATAIQSIVRGRQTRQSDILNVKRKGKNEQKSKLPIQTLWNAKQTNVAAINKETLTILDEFMNEQYSIKLTKPLFEKLWVDNSTFRFNGKHLIRNMNYEGGGGGINEEQEKQWVLQ